MAAALLYEELFERMGIPVTASPMGTGADAHATVLAELWLEDESLLQSRPCEVFPIPRGAPAARTGATRGLADLLVDSLDSRGHSHPSRANDPRIHAGRDRAVPTQGLSVGRPVH
jgi:hypothetical protein